jgi:hypothetical protein
VRRSLYFVLILLAVVGYVNYIYWMPRYRAAQQAENEWQRILAERRAYRDQGAAATLGKTPGSAFEFDFGDFSSEESVTASRAGSSQLPSDHELRNPFLKLEDEQFFSRHGRLPDETERGRAQAREKEKEEVKPSYRLTATLLGRERNMALLDGKIYAQGESVGSEILETISPFAVILRDPKNDRRRRLEIGRPAATKQEAGGEMSPEDSVLRSSLQGEDS